MARHVERGEGEQALKLFAKADAGSPAVKLEARRVALLAMRQTKVPLEREATLLRERLRLLAADGTMPEMDGAEATQGESAGGEGETGEGETGEGSTGNAEPAAPTRSLKAAAIGESYRVVLHEAIARLDTRDTTHRTSLTLLLGELDRLPKAEALWLYGVNQISSWKLDQGLEARYRLALESFGGTPWWNRLARWYVRYQKSNELKLLGDDVVKRFRSSEIFARDIQGGLVPVEGQPDPYMLYGSYLRLKALERFPASPLVLREAESHLLLRSTYERGRPYKNQSTAQRGVLEDSLVELRTNAVLFADEGKRSALLDRFMAARTLEAFLAELEQSPPNPVTNRFLVDGWARLSKFEKAVAPADRLAADYPGDGGITSDTLSLHRSLSAFDPAHAAAHDRIARRVAASMSDPSAIWTALGETWQDLDRPLPAGEAWRHIVDDSPRDPAKILELSTTFWDYGRMREALDVIEAGRVRLKRPRLHAFEAGVLKEELRDLPGALEEYVTALRGHDDQKNSDETGGDYRATSRLSRLIARPRVEALLLSRVERLKPGTAADEDALVPLLSLLDVSPEEANSFDDWMNAPNDPVGRELRQTAREDARPTEDTGIVRLGERVFKKTMAMVPAAVRPELLIAVRQARVRLLDKRWVTDPAREVDFEDALLAREAALAPNEEQRIAKEIARADFLRGKDRLTAASALWTSLAPRIEALPDGAEKMKHLVALARFDEAAGRDAAARWKTIGARYPWSLGVLEDRLDFGFRTKRDAESLELLERAAATAASGHKERLVERLAHESLDHDDLPRARRALTILLALPIDDARRVTMAALLTRISIRGDAAFDPTSIARAEAAKLPEELHADLWYALADAARRENQLPRALDLMIEALNRRTERFWLDDACRLAVRSGRADHLLKFFETQRARSPRDVRWVIAVRQIKTFLGDLPGAIAAARAAAIVAPEKENLHRETVELLVRAGQFREAGEFLEEWARPRRSDEAVAGWRAGLFVKAGDVNRALAVERAAIDAFKSNSTESPETIRTESRERTARAARRFLGLNRAEAAWTLAVPGGDLSRASTVPLTHAERAEIALRSRNFPKLLAAFERDDSFRSAAASVLSRIARPDQLDEVQGLLLGRLFPADGSKNEVALNRWWGFAPSAGLSRFSEAVARKLLQRPESASARYSASPPVAFLREIQPVESVEVVERGTKRSRLKFATGDFTPQWVRFLAERDRLADLTPILLPLVAQLDTSVRSELLPGELPFTRWFPLQEFAHLAALPEQAGLRSSVDGWFRTPQAWARFTRATGSRWDARILLPLLDDAARTSWLAHTAESATTALSPVERKRREATARVSGSLAALVDGRKDALAAADIVRLRGPRRLGEVLSKDARFTWSEFAPLEGETGSDANTGSGVDVLRAPDRLWGAAPGEAWFVLEAIARWREKSDDAPFVPLEAPLRGGEKLKTLLAVRTAEGLGNSALALDLDERYFADLAERSRLVRRLRLLKKNGAGDRAIALFTTEIRAGQVRAGEESLAAWQRTASDLELPEPIQLLDPKKPVSGPLLAALYDLTGPETSGRFHCLNPVDFRTALAARWNPNLDSLSREKTNRYLDELWAEGGQPYPGVAARKLGPWWLDAGRFLSGLDARLRKEALVAVRALPDPKLLRALATRTDDRREPTEFLLARAELATSEEASALARLERVLKAGSGSSPIRFEDTSAPAPDSGSIDAPENPDAPVSELAAVPIDPPSDAGRLTLWLRLFRTSKKPDVVSKAEAMLSVEVRRALDGNESAVGIWALALELARTPEERSLVLTELDRSWTRGEWSPATAESVAAMLVEHDVAAAQRWLGRLDEAASFAAVERRARLLIRLKEPARARLEWTAARARLAFSRDEELRAFDAWRHIQDPAAAPPGTPAAWLSALEFWKKKASDLDVWGDTLAAHLVRHPYDALAARVVLRSLAPAREEFVAPALPLLANPGEVPALRIARHEFRRSERSARHVLGQVDVDATDLRRRRFFRAEIDGALSDVARIAAKTSDASLLERSLAQLQQRNAPGVHALRTELGVMERKNAARPQTVIATGASFQALRPRDLTWDVYTRILNTEEVP
ncbi:MAG: hypothetical protein ABIT01_08230 [Thermoanaerobaculia bacterium]